MKNLEKIALWRATVDRLKAERELACRAVIAERAALGTAADTAEYAATARAVARDLATGVQQRAHGRIARVVSRGLEGVFDEPYEFHIIFEQKRGQTEARLVFIRDGEEIDPTRAAGGGTVDVAAFGLRLACLMLSMPPRRRVLFLDEPFKWVSAGYRGRCRALLEALAAEMRVQIIMVTHIRELVCGTVVEIE